MTRILLVAGLLWATTFAWAAAPTPSWAASGGSDTDFDSRTTLTGYGMSSFEGKAANGAQQAAKDQALKDLAQRLKVSIDASSRITDSSSGTQNFSSYQSDVKAMVSLDLGGVENYEIFFDASANRWVALAVLNKATLRDNLDTTRVKLVAQLDSDLSEVKSLVSKKRLDLLQSSLAAMEKHLDDLVQNVVLARQLGKPLDVSEVLQKYYTAKDEVRSGALAVSILNEKDLVNALVKAFSWKDLTGKSVQLVPAVYKTTDISGEFFYNLREDLSDALQLTVKGLKVVAGTPTDTPAYKLRGSYYEAGDGWHVVFKLTNLVTGDLAGTWDTDLDIDFVRAQKFKFVPDNLNIAAIDRDLQVALYDNPVKTELKVWTNKGSEGLVFEEGEYVEFSLQVNRPGYVSVLYHLAGDQRRRTPLVENVRIFPKDVGKPYKLDRMGPFTPPFGSEAAQVFYSPEPMAPYATQVVSIDNYEFAVLAEDYNELLVKTRGIGGLAKSKVSADQAQWKTDTTLPLTIVPKRKK